MNWRAQTILALDYLDDRLLRHRFMRVCTYLAASGWWDCVTITQSERHLARLARRRSKVKT